VSEPSKWAIVISICALGVSLLTMWATLFRRGRLYMSQPTQILLGPDGPTFDGSWKIYLRSLMYTTGKRGIVIENMFVEVSKGETIINFPIWVLGEERLARGGGLFVGEQGAIANHHFLQSRETEKWVFRSGDYRLQVYAQLAGKKAAELLFETILTISSDQSKELETSNTAIFFDWGPKSRSYLSHIDRRISKGPGSEVEPFLETLLSASKVSKKKV
jgi:hypothetical protein